MPIRTPSPVHRLETRSRPGGTGQPQPGNGRLKNPSASRHSWSGRRNPRRTRPAETAAMHLLDLTLTALHILSVVLTVTRLALEHLG